MGFSQEIAALDRAELRAVLVEKMTSARILYAEMLDVINEMSHSCLPDEVGYPSLAAFVAQLLHCTPQKAARMVAQAEQVTETVTPVGYVAPAKLPSVREGLHAGAIDPEHVQAVHDTLEALPDWATVDHRELVETTLAETAKTYSPRTVKAHGRRLLERIDQDGANPHRDEPAEVVNTFHSARTANGGMRFRGQVDPETGDILQAMIDALAKPAPPAPNIPDPRPAEQRRGDAFADIVHLAGSSSRLPDQGGQRPQVHVHMDLNLLLEGLGVATLDGGACLCASEARRLLCDADVIPIVLNGQSVPLDVGRKRRVVSRSQRRALIARDLGCSFPGCHLPARWADAHHVQHWADGGPTDVPNLCLLCRRHHRLVHESEWSIHMINGIPWFQPPKWIDVDQTLIRNVLHHPRQ
jgi:Domain of unknown function (DUF222)/HNH endonuclease